MGHSHCYPIPTLASSVIRKIFNASSRLNIVKETELKCYLCDMNLPEDKHIEEVNSEILYALHLHSARYFYDPI